MDQRFENDVMQDLSGEGPAASSDAAAGACDRPYRRRRGAWLPADELDALDAVIDLAEEEDAIEAAAPVVKKSFDATTKWDVVEVVLNRYRGGIAEPAQRAKMAADGAYSSSLPTMISR